MDIYEVAYMFNGIEHRVDVAAVNGPDAAFRVGQNLYPTAEYRGVRLVKGPIELNEAFVFASEDGVRVV